MAVRIEKAAFCRRSGGASNRIASGLGIRDFEQLDFEDERCAARNRGRVPAVAIGDIGGTNQGGLAANLHLLNAFGPTLNHLIESKLSWFVPLVRAVELRAI